MTPAELRKQLRNRRNQLSPDQQLSHANQALNHFKQLLSSLETTQPLNIALFLSQDAELPTQETIQFLWRETQHHVFLPVLETRPDQHMAFVSYDSNSTMITNQFGIEEPKLPLDKHQIGEAMDIVLVPLVGFDQQGNRLGMGGGYYDRTFAFKHTVKSNRPLLIGWAHQCQEVELLPKEPWDIPLDALISEQGILKWFS